MKPFLVSVQIDETPGREKLMTSSSSKNTQKECCWWKGCEDSRGKKQVQKKEDWLELTLGLGSDDDDPSSKMIMVYHDDDGSTSNSSLNSPSQSSSSSPQQQQGQEIIASGFGSSEERHHHHDYYLPFGPFPSSSSSPFMLCKSMPVPLQSHGLSRPALNVPNHYYIPRPHPGFWFTLRSTMNRNGEVLPQITKPYIRLKDANVTVLMVKTYLVRKLGLTNEAEVEISCMGQALLHSQTIKYVRDAIWVPKLVEFVYNSSPTMLDFSQIVNHLMSLEYGKS